MSAMSLDACCKDLRKTSERGITRKRYAHEFFILEPEEPASDFRVKFFEGQGQLHGLAEFEQLALRRAFQRASVIDVRLEPRHDVRDALPNLVRTHRTLTPITLFHDRHLSLLTRHFFLLKNNNEKKERKKR